MNLAELSIKRPTFITSIIILIILTGYMTMKRIGIDLFPNVTFPVVMINTVYKGAGPKEIETLVSKVLEEEVSTLSGIKSVRSVNKEGISTIIAEFNLETNVRYAEQEIRDRVGSAKKKMPQDIEEPIIRRIDPAEQPVLVLAITSDINESKLYDLANEVIKPKIEQVNQVGLVEALGIRKREIKVELDRNKLNSYEIAASDVADRIAAAGQNIPVGKVEDVNKEVIFRTLGEFKNLDNIKTTIVNFLGNDVPVTVSELGTVSDSLEDENSRVFVNGKKSAFLMVFRQSGSNTIAVVDGVKKKLEKINAELKNSNQNVSIKIVRDSSKMIRANIDDVRESIFLGILLTVLVVFIFLRNARSTIITGLALPNSLLGAFILMSVSGFTINMMTLLALSLAVGLLIDDAIVVRENIFRHGEMGKTPIQAALEGTKEVTMAVIATTLTVIAVFGPIAFLKGIVGQFFKEFGLTVCFAMAISLFDALTIAPMLSAYFAIPSKKGQSKHQEVDNSRLSQFYEKILVFTVRKPKTILLMGVVIFVLSIVSTSRVPKTFLPPQDIGEFSVGLDMPPGTSLDKMTEVAKKVDEVIRNNKEVEFSVMSVGSRDHEANVTDFFIQLVSRKNRTVNTSEFKDVLRTQLKEFKYANPTVKDVDMVGGGFRPFNLSISGTDFEELEKVAKNVFEKLKDHPGLKDVDISHRPGKPEFQVITDETKARRLGVSTLLLGKELRTQVEGATPAVFRENGLEYDIRVRLKEDQRDLKSNYSRIMVPNINHRLVRLNDVAHANETTGPANINRQDRSRYIMVSADIAPNGPGMNAVIKDIEAMFSNDIKLPAGMGYRFLGQAEDFKDLIENMLLALFLATVFIYLVLASLYESFVTPFTIMLVLPLAACGAFFALFITGKSLDIYSMIGCILLLGIATKNSILLVDYANHLILQGVSHSEAVIRAGKARLRPILMTSFALIAGMLPVAIGLNEASRQRTSMGVSVIGGMVSSTLLALVVIPAAYSYIERFRNFSRKNMSRLIGRSDLAQPSSNHAEPTVH